MFLWSAADYLFTGDVNRRNTDISRLARFILRRTWRHNIFSFIFECVICVLIVPIHFEYILRWFSETDVLKCKLTPLFTFWKGTFLRHLGKHFLLKNDQKLWCFQNEVFNIFIKIFQRADINLMMMIRGEYHKTNTRENHLTEENWLLECSQSDCQCIK